MKVESEKMVRGGNLDGKDYCQLRCSRRDWCCIKCIWYLSLVSESGKADSCGELHFIRRSPAGICCLSDHIISEGAQYQILQEVAQSDYSRSFNKDIYQEREAK